MSDLHAWQADLFLLEKWQDDSSLSTDSQREHIFSEFVALGIRGRKVAEESGYDPAEDENPWTSFYSDYHMQLVMNRIHIVDKTTLASKGRDAGKVPVVFVDECGRPIRYSRLELEEAADIVNLENFMLIEHGSWANAQVGESYEWGAPLGPPYGENGGDTSE
ncbi:uncharacterized protein N7482_008116 [Penicillium canariense]|uniref:Uncharacterized protein n=1 Tax=Penicillium canariense TaxID=189055 RepID=A0A9W9LH74_9EURO|nr:uncharacterized protein N7482_008116 [Penicillium canariense]KAJ5157016.1 hypothetical protein N7482_008116 [Penicillium canariense]